MGISRGAAEFLLREAKRRTFFGWALMLGRQEVAFGLAEWAIAAARRGISVASTSWSEGNKISDANLFCSLGCDKVLALDVTDHGAPEISADLNLDWAHSELRRLIPFGQFDVVFDGGTLEHVFNVPQALANLHEVLRVGGRIIHVLPASNFLDHGFWSFSPKLLGRYYAANGYEINRLSVCRCAEPGHPLLGPWEFRKRNIELAFFLRPRA